MMVAPQASKESAEQLSAARKDVIMRVMAVISVIFGGLVLAVGGRLVYLLYGSARLKRTAREWLRRCFQCCLKKLEPPPDPGEPYVPPPFARQRFAEYFHRLEFRPARPLDQTVYRS